MHAIQLMLLYVSIYVTVIISPLGVAIYTDHTPYIATHTDTHIHMHTHTCTHTHTNTHRVSSLTILVSVFLDDILSDDGLCVSHVL